jgi:hypothetical protein
MKKGLVCSELCVPMFTNTRDHAERRSAGCQWTAISQALLPPRRLIDSAAAQNLHKKSRMCFLLHSQTPIEPIPSPVSQLLEIAASVMAIGINIIAADGVIVFGGDWCHITSTHDVLANLRETMIMMEAMIIIVLNSL